MTAVDLLIFDDYAGGGVQRSAMALRKVLADAGHDVRINVLSAHATGLAKEHDFVRPLLARRPVGKLAYWWATLRTLRARLRARRGIAIGFGVSANLLLILAAAGLRHVRLIGSERVYPPLQPTNRRTAVLRRRLYRRLDVVVSQTERTQRWMREAIGVRPDRLKVIPNIIRPAAPGAEWQLRPAGSTPTVACVGRFDPQKGFDFALEILADCVAHGCAPRLLLVGDAEGDSRPRLEAQAASLGVAHLVEFRPRLDRLEALWPTIDLLLFPSRFEGFPNTLAEAMAHGVPVVSFDCPTGPAELIEDGANGFLVPMGDVAAAGDRVRRLLGDPALAARLGRAARAVSDTYAEDRVGALWLALVERLTRR